MISIHAASAKRRSFMVGFYNDAASFAYKGTLFILLEIGSPCRNNTHF